MEDLIKRSDVIKVIEEIETERLRGQINLTYAPTIKRVNDLPSADRPSGEWTETSSGEHWKCSVCGCRAPYYMYKSGEVEWVSDYCPNCGAKMVAKDTNVPNKKGADDE